MVLMALIPWQPAESAAREGSSIWVTFGVILAHTGTLAARITQPQTSFRISGLSPIADPIRRSGRPCGQEKLHSNASTPTSWQRSTISIQASWRYSSMIDAISARSGYLSLIRLNSSSQVPKSRSLISSMFSQPIISCESAARSRAYLGCTFTTLEASRLIVLQMTAPQPSSKALPITLAFVPGGPEAMISGLGSFRPSTVVLKSAMGFSSAQECSCRAHVYPLPRSIVGTGYQTAKFILRCKNALFTCLAAFGRQASTHSTSWNSTSGDSF